MNLIICVNVTTVFGWVSMAHLLSFLCCLVVVFFLCCRGPLSCVPNVASASVLSNVPTIFQLHYMVVSFICKTRYSEIATDLTNGQYYICGIESPRRNMSFRPNAEGIFQVITKLPKYKKSLKITKG